MKILVLALPRTGSKFVTSSLCDYTYNGNIIYRDDLFHTDFSTYMNNKLEFVDGHIIKLSEKLNNIDSFFENRLELVDQLPKGLVIKFHYNLIRTRPDLLIKMIPKFDHVIHLARRDIFDSLLSVVIANLTHSWHPCIYQNNVKNHLLKQQKLVITPAQWINLIEQTKISNTLPFGNSVKVYSEDIFNTDSSTFCTLLNLPYKTFEIKKDTKEFGEDKYKYIRNLDELHSIFNERMGFTT